MDYKVSTLRNAGLDAKWSKTKKGAPIIVAKNPSANNDHQKNKWWYVDRSMWALMTKHGIMEGFNSCTILGDIFYI